MTKHAPDPLAVPLVGRAIELRRLDAAVDRAAGGRGGTLLLAGAAGVGKSRLAEEALVRAGGRGFLALRGTAYPLHGDLAYAPFLEALGPSVTPELARGLPDLGRLFGGAGWEPAPQLDDPALARTRLLDAVAQLVDRLSRTRPLVLFVDDLHWADHASVELFHYLARGLAGQPVLLVGAYRSDEVTAPGPLATLLRTLRRLGLAEQISLGALPRDEVAELVRALLGGAAPADLMAALEARVVDTPLFVSALVGDLIAAGDLRRHGGGWVLIRRPDAAIPAVIRDLMLGRLERLEPADREWLEWVAVAGDSADRAVLAHAAAAEPSGPLGRLTAAGLLVDVPDGRRLVYRAYHPLLSEITYAELPGVVRRRRHAAIVRALEARHPGDVARLAHHYRGAGDELPADRALDVLLAAAEQAMDVHADEEAAAHLAAALDAARVVRPAAVGDLLERLGTAQSRAGHSDEAIDSWRAALSSASPCAAGRLHGLIAGLVWDQGRFADAERELAAGFTALDGVPDDAELLDLRLRRIRMLGRVGDLEELEKEAAALQPLAADPRAAAALYLVRGDAAFMRGRLPEAVDRARQAAAAAEAAIDPVSTAHAYRQVFIAELSLGNFAAAREANAADRAAAERSGVPTVLASPRMSLLLLALATDAWDEGMRTADSVLALGHRIGAGRAVAAALSFQAIVLAEQGRTDEAQERLAEGREAYGRGAAADRHIFAATEMAEATVALVRGDAERARELARSGSTIPGLLPCLTLGVLVRAELALGDVAGARATVRRLDAMAAGPWPVACAAWLDGLVRAAAGPDADAVGLAGLDADAAGLAGLDADAVGLAGLDAGAAGLAGLDAGARGLAALDLPFQAARARLDWAEVAQRQDPEGARLAVSQCLGVFERFGARPLADRCRQLLRGLGVRPAAGPREPRADLSAREREVVALVAAGLSNTEVAARLFISPRTVTTHLQNVYARLELPSRAALVRWAIERGPDT